MTKNTYNGYTNYETWAVALHIDNDSYTQDYFKDCVITALSDNEGDIDESINCIVNTLEMWLEENTPEVDGIYADLLNAAISEVDEYDIAKTMVDEYFNEWQENNQTDEDEEN